MLEITKKSEQETPSLNITVTYYLRWRQCVINKLGNNLQKKY